MRNVEYESLLNPRTIIYDARDPLFFFAPPLTAPRRHASLFSGFSDLFTARSTYATPVLLWQFGFITFFRVMLVRIAVHGMQGPLEKAKAKASAFPLRQAVLTRKPP